jgi:hypothetical protein
MDLNCDIALTNHARNKNTILNSLTTCRHFFARFDRFYDEYNKIIDEIETYVNENL